MATKFVPLEDAAKALGISTDRLVQLRSDGELRGFRDGDSWKFPQGEIDRLIESGIAAGLSGDRASASNSGDILNLGNESGSDADVLIGLGKDDPSGSRIDLVSNAGASGDNIFVGGSGSSQDSLDGEVSVTASGSGDVIFPESEPSGEELLMNLGSDSGASSMGDQSFAIESQSDQKIVPELGGSEDDLLMNLESNSGADVLGRTRAGSAASNLSDEMIPTIAGSEDDLLANLDSRSDANLLDGEEILEIAGSEEDLLAEMLSESNTSMLGDANTGDTEPRSDSVDLDIEDSDGDIDLSLADGIDLDSGRRVPNNQPSDGMDIDLNLADNALSDGHEIDLTIQEPSSGGSDLNLDFAGDVNSGGGSVLDLAGSGESVLGSDASDSLIRGDSDPSVLGGGGSALSLADDDDDDLVISDDEADMVLDSAGSDISVVGESGINLMSPADSGLSLESEPLDLAGSSISALDLGSEGPDSGAPGSGSGSSASLVDFQADEEFQLSPSGIGLDVDDDSGSQVIAVEDSGSISEVIGLDTGMMEESAGGLVGDYPDETAEPDPVADPIEEEAIIVDDQDETAPVMPLAAASYEVPYSLFQVLFLALNLLMLCGSGILMSDLVRNLWFDGKAGSPVSSLTATLLKAVGMSE